MYIQLIASLTSLSLDTHVNRAGGVRGGRVIAMSYAGRCEKVASGTHLRRPNESLSPAARAFSFLPAVKASLAVLPLRERERERERE